MLRLTADTLGARRPTGNGRTALYRLPVGRTAHVVENCGPVRETTLKWVSLTGAVRDSTSSAPQDAS